jgi:hypothetical protein
MSALWFVNELNMEVTMRTLILAAVSALALGMGGVGVTHAADTNNAGPTPGSNTPPQSGTSQPSQAGVNSPNMPSSLPPSPNRPTGSMADPPLASPPAGKLGGSTAPDK